jgi:acetolactate synthase-1/2/3 large subunit
LPTVADVLAQTLHESGIDTVFGLPGGENVEIVDSLRRHNIDFVLVHNESSAVYMADVTARLTGKPGVCLTTLGPGATNAMAGVGHAWLDRAPVLILTAHTPEHLLSYHTHQVIDQSALFAPITKQSITLKASYDIQSVVHNALDLTMRERRGPVHLQLSREAAAQEVEVESDLERQPIAIESQSPNQEAFDLAATLLAQSQRPIIVAGLGLEPEHPYATLGMLAEAAQAPVITTPKAKGSITHDHPLAAGTIGLTRTDPVYNLLAEADCILAVGFDVVELVKPWDETAPLIWIAPWPNIDPPIAAVAELVGPMQPVLEQLAQLPCSSAANWGQTRVASHRQELSQTTLPYPAPGRMTPQAVLQAIRANVPPDTLVSVDVGSHKILTSLDWPDMMPNRFMVSNGLSCMGFGFPAAIAGSLALDHATTVCVTGDAGLAMNLGELELLTRLDTPVIVVVMNDSALDLIRSAQVRAGKPPYGTVFTNPDFVKIGEAYGIAARRVTNEAECAEAVRIAVAAKRPMLIEAMIDPASYPTTPRQP